ncbi:hypothetical protein LBWT_Y0470 (plasmid) [Leptolyngbya boryana IAM M-101]|nr:hypothetical protein LBWT_Y0470 [Leptolyngbya boryana IAM M-101]BAS66807.1 hypothetical protein LBDG_Y0470 [Leptolyngbya boryana dg5]
MAIDLRIASYTFIFGSYLLKGVIHFENSWLYGLLSIIYQNY